MAISALLFSPLISFMVHIISKALGKKEKEDTWVLKKNLNNILLIFLIIMFIEIVILNHWQANIVY